VKEKPLSTSDHFDSTRLANGLNPDENKSVKPKRENQIEFVSSDNASLSKVAAASNVKQHLVGIGVVKNEANNFGENNVSS